MTRIIKILICVCLSTGMIIGAGASNAKAYDTANALNAADVLNALGLFNGSASGYHLERSPTRAEAFAMLIRFLGAERRAQRLTEGKAAEQNRSQCPFTDIKDEWFEPYALYAYSAGLTNGVGNNLFAPQRTITAKEYAAMLLRALEYEFLYDNAVRTAANIGIFNYAAASTEAFLRGDMVLMSYGALFCDNVKTGTSLLQGLVGSGVVTTDKLKNADFTGVKLVRTPDTQELGDSAFSVGRKKLKTGMNRTELTAALGEPDRIDQSFYGFEWQVYNADYSEFIMVGVDAEGKAVAFYSNSGGAAYRGITVGQICPQYSDSADSVATVFTDKFDSDRVNGILVLPRDCEIVSEWSAQMITAAEYQLMDIANGERANRGINALSWSDAAARAAKYHSTDMSAKNYFSHTSDDGRSLSDRMSECGLIFTAAAENIAQGYSSVFSVHHAWMNSEGHRKNLIDQRLTHFGAGITADRYYTQDFFGV